MADKKKPVKDKKDKPSVWLRIWNFVGNIHPGVPRSIDVWIPIVTVYSHIAYIRYMEWNFDRSFKAHRARVAKRRAKGLNPGVKFR